MEVLSDIENTPEDSNRYNIITEMVEVYGIAFLFLLDSYNIDY